LLKESVFLKCIGAGSYFPQDQGYSQFKAFGLDSELLAYTM
jgi:hypothetical protein